MRVDFYRFAGVYTKELQHGHILHQQSYMERLDTLKANSLYPGLSSSRARLTWIKYTRSETAAILNLQSSVTYKTFYNAQIKLYNETLKILQVIQTVNSERNHYILSPFI